MNDIMQTAGLDEMVRARAYALWESEGRPDGRDAEHWRRSEEEMLRTGTVVTGRSPLGKPRAKKGGRRK